VTNGVPRSGTQIVRMAQRALSHAVCRLVPASPLLWRLSACAPTEGRVPDAPPAPAAAPVTTEGSRPVPGGRVWYRRLGAGPGIPLLAAQGGPGGTSCCFAALAPLQRRLGWPGGGTTSHAH
jgi:hypothetical protein